jgi:hypothetical protein
MVLGIHAAPAPFAASNGTQTGLFLSFVRNFGKKKKENKTL